MESMKTILHADVGWSTAEQRARWYQSYHVEGNARRSITFQRFVALPGSLLTRTREQLMGDAEWYRCAEFQEMHRYFGVDDLLVSAKRTKHPPMVFALFTVRDLGEKRHGEREQRLVHLFHHELSRYVGTALALAHDEVFATLPPRLRQTLECLLEGDSEKQAALRMGLSRHTVHDYVTALYRRLGVSSRPELMALCLRRRR
jgi:DNA-binding CsgD family transcriptional regulator